MKHEQRWKNYDEFLKSPEWLHLREMVLKRAGNKCQLCDSSGKIQVHHRNYSAKWGEESTDDLIALCGSCHRWFHKLESKRAKSKKRERKAEKEKPPITKSEQVLTKKQKKAHDFLERMSSPVKLFTPDEIAAYQARM